MYNIYEFYVVLELQIGIISFQYLNYLSMLNNAAFFGVNQY